MESYYKQRCATLEALVSKLAEKLFRADLDLVKETLQVLSEHPDGETSLKGPLQADTSNIKPELPKQNILSEI